MNRNFPHEILSFTKKNYPKTIRINANNANSQFAKPMKFSENTLDGVFCHSHLFEKMFLPYSSFLEEKQKFYLPGLSLSMRSGE